MKGYLHKTALCLRRVMRHKRRTGKLLEYWRVQGRTLRSETPTVTAEPTPTLTPTSAIPNGNAEYIYDGDGNMVKSVIGSVTTYYPSSSYEKRVEGATETVMKYYFAGSVRIAMRENGAITWLLSDHLGSTSVTADGAGSLLASLKYTAYGEIRTGSSLTDYQYTGQRNEAEIGLYYYVARFYDPELGRFISADTIVPEPGSVKAYDRFAYVNGNPINFNDPSGHKACDGNGNSGECKSITKQDYLLSLRIVYKWNAVGNWTTRTTGILLDSANEVEKRISVWTNGNGRGWMLQNTGNTTFVNKASSIFFAILDGYKTIENNTETRVPAATPKINQNNQVFLNRNGINSDVIMQEIGHLADNNSKQNALCSATWCGGGVADDLARFVGVEPSGIRWLTSIDNSLPQSFRWKQNVHGGYGNSATVEYFGEAVYWMMIDPSKLPNSEVRQWMMDYFVQ